MHCYRKNLVLCLMLISTALSSRNAFGATTGVNTPPASGQVLNLGTQGNTYVTIDTSGNVGIGMTSPGAKLDIQSSTSGLVDYLRLSSTAANATNDGQRLSWYDIPDTVVVGSIDHVKTGVGIYEFRFNNWNGSTLNQAMTINTSGNVGIGTASPITTLNVYSSTYGYSGAFYGKNVGSAATAIGSRLGIGAIQAFTDNSLLTPTNLALQGSGGAVGIGANPGGSWELEVHAPTGVHGIYGIPTSAANWGVGGWTADGTGAGGLGVANWAGVYGVAPTGGWAGYFSGNVFVTGNVQSGAYYHNSDARLKTDIHPIDHALDKILALKGVEFNWKNDGHPDMGLTAQNVETVFPNVVRHDDKGMMAVEYDSMVAPIIEAIRELKVRDDHLAAVEESETHELEIKNQELEAEIADIKKSLKKTP